MRLGSGIAVAMVQAGGYSSDSTWEPPYATGVGLKMKKKKAKTSFKEDFQVSIVSHKPETGYILNIVCRKGRESFNPPKGKDTGEKKAIRQEINTVCFRQIMYQGLHSTGDHEHPH